MDSRRSYTFFSAAAITSIGFVGFGKYRNDELENAGEVFAIYILSQYYGKGTYSLLIVNIQISFNILTLK